MTTDDQQPTDAPEPRVGADADTVPGDAPPGETEPEAAPDAKDASEADEMDTARFRVLPIAEQLRRLREQFEDPDWRSRARRITLARTVDEDPLGHPYLATFPEAARRQDSLDRSWIHAQEALDATELGRVTRPTLELLPAGREFLVVLRIPGLDGTMVLTTRGWRTPNGAMRHTERHFVRILIEENAPVLAARQAAEREAASAREAAPAAPGSGDAAAGSTRADRADPA